MPKLKNSVPAVVLTVFMVAGGFLSTHAAELDLQKQQELINERIQESQNLLQKKKKEENRALLELRYLNNTLNTAEQKLRTTEKNLNHTEAELQYLEGELKASQQNLAQNTDALAKRLQDIYKQGDVQVLEVLLGSTSVTDFLTRWDLLCRIAENDTQLIEQVRDEIAFYEEKQQQATAKKQLLDTLRRDQQEQRQVLQVASSRQKEVLKGIQSERAMVEQILDELEEESNRIAAEIRKLQGDQAYQGSDKMYWPTPGYTRITSPFGMRRHPILKTMRMHTGLDIGAANGSTIRAAENGKVLYVGWRGAYGRVVILDHGGGITTMYAHTSATLVNTGATVKKGDPIAKVGSTGWSTGPHLHFEVRKNGEPVSPLSYLK